MTQDTFQLTDAEVRIAMSLGIQFRQVPVGNGYVRMETVNQIRFFYENHQIKIEEYLPHGGTITHLIEVV